MRHATMACCILLESFPMTMHCMESVSPGIQQRLFALCFEGVSNAPVADFCDAKSEVNKNLTRGHDFFVMSCSPLKEQSCLCRAHTYSTSVVWLFYDCVFVTRPSFSPLSLSQTLTYDFVLLSNSVTLRFLLVFEQSISCDVPSCSLWFLLFLCRCIHRPVTLEHSKTRFC